MTIKRNVKRTERGWHGHFDKSDKCLFSRNTLLETGDIRYVISTLGAYCPEEPEAGCEKINPHGYYETLIFEAKQNEVYWDIDSEKQLINPAGIPWYLEFMNFNADKDANEMHEETVTAVSSILEKGGFLQQMYPSLEALAKDLGAEGNEI